MNDDPRSAAMKKYLDSSAAAPVAVKGGWPCQSCGYGHEAETLCPPKQTVDTVGHTRSVVRPVAGKVEEVISSLLAVTAKVARGVYMPDIDNCKTILSARAAMERADSLRVGLHRELMKVLEQLQSLRPFIPSQPPQVRELHLAANEFGARVKERCPSWFEEPENSTDFANARDRLAKALLDAAPVTPVSQPPDLEKIFESVLPALKFTGTEVTIENLPDRGWNSAIRETKKNMENYLAVAPVSGQEQISPKLAEMGRRIYGEDFVTNLNRQADEEARKDLKAASGNGPEPRS